MSVRALDSSGDWTFGTSGANYISGNPEVVQNIQTRLSSFLGNCFFDMGAGIDWFNLLAQKNQLALNLAISAMIINTDNVVGLLQLSVNLNGFTRAFSVSYQVQTTYSVTGNTFQYNLAE